jgi:hypothetical protein
MEATTTYRVKSTVSMERLDGETIAIDFDSGRFFSFRETAADLLWLVTQGVRIGQFSLVLRNYFTIAQDLKEIDKQIEEFLQALTVLNIIEPIADPPSKSIIEVVLPDDYVRAGWVSPMMTSNDQLADLLKIDPIHDVGEGGWPESPSP